MTGKNILTDATTSQQSANEQMGRIPNNSVNQLNNLTETRN